MGNDTQSQSQTQENAQRLCPKKRRAEYVKHTTAPAAKYTSAPDYEDERLSHRQFMKNYQNGVYNQIFDPEQPTAKSQIEPDQEGSQVHRNPPGHTVQGIVLKEPCIRVSKCCACSCHFPATERQWASPQDAAEILGVSTAIMRSLAHARNSHLYPT